MGANADSLEIGGTEARRAQTARAPQTVRDVDDALARGWRRTAGSPRPRRWR
jgi:hypothetical protein